VIHIESPVQREFTPGTVVDICGQPLGANRIRPAQGVVTATVNGTRFVGNPGRIPLRAHDVIQLAVGAPVAFRPYVFPPGL
jgi:hypothetical protein